VNRKYYPPAISSLSCVTQEHQRILRRSDTALVTWNCQPRFVARIDSSRKWPAVRQVEIVRVETPAMAAISRGSSHVRTGSGRRSSSCLTSWRRFSTSPTSLAIARGSIEGGCTVHLERGLEELARFLLVDSWSGTSAEASLPRLLTGNLGHFQELVCGHGAVAHLSLGQLRGHGRYIALFQPGVVGRMVHRQ